MTEGIPFDVKKWINPKLTKELLDDLDISIDKIAEKIDKETFVKTKNKISGMTFENNDTEVDILVDEYFNKITESILNKQTLSIDL